MAAISSAATGNWSAGATWVGGVAPTTAGQEIGEAVSAAMADIAQSNLQTADKLSQAIIQAIREQTAIPQKPVHKWMFRVERDDKGLITNIIATATVESK